MERAVIHGLSVVRAESLISLTRVHAVAEILRTASSFGTEPGHVVRDATRADLAFTLPHGAARRAAAALRARGELVTLDESVAEVVLTGAGMRSDVAVVATFCEALARCGVPLTPLVLEANRLSVLCAEYRVTDALRALGEVFEVIPPTPRLSRAHRDEGSIL